MTWSSAEQREPQTNQATVEPSVRRGSPADLAPLRLLLDPPADGAWNMAVDETLLESAANEGQCTLRFYRWAKPTLSLGYFQTYADRWQHEPSRDAAVVRRASGGGAILHDNELTYSFALPDRHPLAIDRLGFYRAVHAALIAVFAQHGIQATMFEPSKSCGGSCTAVAQPFLCFQRRSPGDVLIGHAKVAGSAQRRCRGAVLQHGSVLLARSAAAPELDGLKELLGNSIAPEQLAEEWLAQLAHDLPKLWQNEPLSDAEHRRSVTLAAEKYASPSWTEHRGRS